VSYEADEAYSVYDETLTRARKEHRCDACKETIRPKDSYWRVRWVFEKSADGVKRCLRCQAVHLHLRKLCWKSYEPLWPDERLNCGTDYEEEWGELPREIAALAFISADEAQKTLIPGVNP
jgi:hypothetical protein